MNEPKIPTDHPSGNWQAVDIFLFPNGKHQTPPRKYHLKADQLNAWDNTLKTLAHSIYGNAQHTINLYTLDGTKVPTPLAISNGEAYVAVPPHHSFISGGYNEYLLKASRSREKRFGKFRKTYTTANGQRGSNVSKAQSKGDSEYFRGIIEEIVDGIKHSIGNQSHISTPSQNSKLGTIFSKSLLKRNSSQPNSPPANKRILSIPRSSLARSSLKSREALPRKSLRISTDQPISKTSTPTAQDSNLIFKLKEITKLSKSKTMVKTDDEVKLKECNEITNATVPKIYETNNNNQVTDGNTIDNILGDNELIIVKNPDSEITTGIPFDKSTSVNGSKFRISSMVMAPIQEVKQAEEGNDDIPLTVINNFVENIYSADMAMSNDVTTKQNTKMQESNVYFTPVDSKVATDNKSPVDGFTAVVNKGDIVSLNLRIEVKETGGGEAASNFEPNLNTPNHIHIIEKSSQANIDEIFFQTLQKHSKLASQLATNEESPKVVILQCSCYSNKNYNDQCDNNVVTPVEIDETKYVLLLPKSQLETERCHCGIANAEEVIDRKTQSRQLSMPYPIKKVYADTSLLIIENPHSVTQSATIGTSTTNLQNSSLRGQKEISEKNNNLKIHKVVSSKEHVFTKSTTSKQLHENPVENVTSTRSVLSKRNSLVTTKHFVDRSTQTEWHTLLLEAKRHEDGRFSFHLPPLQVLKHYSM